MESIDMKKLETALVYLDRIANGNNPVNNLPAEEDSVLNNPNVIRCMFFVKDILEMVKNGKLVQNTKTKKASRKFPVEVLKNYEYEENKSISKFAQQLNRGVDASEYKLLSYKQITDWLKIKGFLTVAYDEVTNKNYSVPTEKGNSLGIFSERREGSGGKEYLYVTYNKCAQQFIINNIESILEFNNK